MTSRRPILAALLLSVVLLTSLVAQSPPPANKGKAGKGGPADIELVEKLLSARRDYQTTLENLRTHYISVGDVERAKWAEEELKQYHRILKQAYRLELDVPPPTLQGQYNVPEANKIYRDAMIYKDKGWGTDYTDNQRRAEILLQQLLSNHPQSDKISDAAYQLGDLYEGKSYHQYGRAAQYYERCVQWNPKTTHEARIRAARIYDRQLNERARAIELYKEVTTHETDAKRMQEAQKRLAELTQGK